MKPSGITVLITGAGGFIGRHCVQTALARGHKVIAVVRSAASVPDSWKDLQVEVVIADLAVEDTQLSDTLMQADAVIHAAASLAGDEAQQLRDTVEATERLIELMGQMPRAQRRLVLVSSISVYGADQLAENTQMDEHSSIENNPDQRDTYCRSKLAQEAISMDAANADKLDLFIMRVGAVFGVGRLWNGHLGHALGPVLLRFGSKGEIPVSYVENCAKALVLAAETPLSGVDVINVVDDDLPDRATYINALRKSGWPRFILPVSWRILSGVGTVSNLVPSISKKLPGLLRPAVLKSRMMPLRYDNSKLKSRLNWQAELAFDAAMKRSIMGEGKGDNE
jgi:nucleoside-diphosphate-sugar epimerase